jgi:hypothetical protein
MANYRKIPIPEEVRNAVVQDFRSNKNNTASAIAERVGLTKRMVNTILDEYFVTLKTKSK